MQNKIPEDEQNMQLPVEPSCCEKASKNLSGSFSKCALIFFTKKANPKILPQIEMEYKQIPYLAQLFNTLSSENTKNQSAPAQNPGNVIISLEEKKREENWEKYQESARTVKEIVNKMDDASKSQNIITIPKEFLIVQGNEKSERLNPILNNSAYSIRKHKPKSYNSFSRNESNKIISKHYKLKKRSLKLMHQ